MTEHDAAQKACCGPPGCGRIETNRLGIMERLCLGSACMAWREIHRSVGPQRVHPNVLGKAWIGWTVTDDTPDHQGYVEISPPIQGRCGLAGE